jgi:hypothetical protein
LTVVSNSLRSVVVIPFFLGLAFNMTIFMIDHFGIGFPEQKLPLLCLLCHCTS